MPCLKSKNVWELVRKIYRFYSGHVKRNYDMVKKCRFDRMTNKLGGFLTKILIKDLLSCSWYTYEGNRVSPQFMLPTDNFMEH